MGEGSAHSVHYFAPIYVWRKLKAARIRGYLARKAKGEGSAHSECLATGHLAMRAMRIGNVTLRGVIKDESGAH